LAKHFQYGNVNFDGALYLSVQLMFSTLQV